MCARCIFFVVERCESVRKSVRKQPRSHTNSFRTHWTSLLKETCWPLHRAFSHRRALCPPYCALRPDTSTFSSAYFWDWIRLPTAIFILLTRLLSVSRGNTSKQCMIRLAIVHQFWPSSQSRVFDHCLIQFTASSPPPLLRQTASEIPRIQRKHLILMKQEHITDTEKTSHSNETRTCRKYRENTSILF